MAVTATEAAFYLRARAAVERELGVARAAQLLAHSEEARRLLVARHGAHRVWLFGSLVAGQPTVDSDIDLAVEGLECSAYFAALADLMALFHGAVDLVRLEDAVDSLRERILAEGREL